MANAPILYEAADGEQPIAAFLAALSPKARTKCISYLRKLIDPGPPLAKAHAEHIRGRLWELKPEWGGVEYRFLYAQLRDGTYIILHAVVKKRQRLRPGEFERAEQRLAEFEERQER